MLTACEMTSDLTGCDSEREVSAFAVMCQGKAVGNMCQGKLSLPLGRVTFVAFPDRQEVVENAGKGGPIKLHNCVVQDWRTWTCSSNDPDGQLTQIMDRGEFTENFQPNPSNTPLPEIVYLPAWRYYWHSFTWKP
jgi:hypothetical protein